MEIRNLADARRFDEGKPAKIPFFQSARGACDLLCLSPGQEQKPHAHPDSDKIYVVLEGCGTFAIGGEVKAVGEKNVVIAPAGVDHGVKNDTATGLVLLVFLAPPPAKH